MRHAPFFEALASAGESQPAGRVAKGCLFLLRRLDTWFMMGPGWAGPDAPGMHMVRDAIAAIDQRDGLRAVLFDALNAMQILPDLDLEPILPRIFAIGTLLEQRRAFPIAADVFDAILYYANEEKSPDLVADAHNRLGYCHRSLGLLDAAESSYSAAAAVAQWWNNQDAWLRSQIGLANVSRSRGNLPVAAELLDTVLAQSGEPRFGRVRVFALMDRAVVAKQRGEFDNAVALFYEAMQRSTLEWERERILSDLGATFVSMNRLDAARDALLILEATATTDGPRMFARTNLLSLAAREGNRAAFDDYRGKLAGAEATPELHVNVLIESGRGWHAFGELELASVALIEACAIAEAHDLNRALVEAEQLSENLNRPAARASHAPTAPSASTSEVERELRRLALSAAV